MNFVMTAQDADLRQDRITLSGNRFRHIDMVLIDDFQYFAGRTALQEQLLQTLRALHQAGRYSPRYAANRQIAPYSRSSMPMSVLPSFLRTFFITARSTTLSFISVTGEPSRSLTVALSRLRTS